jgi:uncharacterized protein (TIGR04255 family)
LPLRRLVAPRENFGDKAPITEALIDIRATIGPDVSLDALKAFAEPWPSDFPQMRTQTQWAGQIRVDAASASVTGEHGVRGFVFLDETGRHVVQVRRDGFTYSKLHPYAKWEDLRDRAKALWQRYREVAAPLQVVRVGVRYINRLKLPAGLVQLPEWFGIHPVLAPELGPMSEFLVRVVVPHPDDKAFVGLVTLATDPPEPPDETPGVLVDVEVWVDGQFQLDDESIWETLEDIREYKNDLFFGTLKDTAKGSLR